MRKILKKTATLMMTAVIGVSMSCPKMIVYAGQRMQMQERYTTPKEWNYAEITAYQFGSTDKFEDYLQTGGTHLYNDKFQEKDHMIKITVADSGYFTIATQTDGNRSQKVKLYDSTKEKVLAQTTADGDLEYGRLAKAGEVFYLQMPEKIDKIFVTTGVIKDGFESMKASDTYYESGTGSTTYHPFSISKRSRVYLEIAPVGKKVEKVGAYVEKNVNGTWQRVGYSANIKPAEYGTALGYGLQPGKYRMVLKNPKDNIINIEYKRKTTNKNVAYKKSKAINVKSSLQNVYTTEEHTARWYKVAVSSTKKRTGVLLSKYSVGGGFQFKVYQKGKVIKTVKVKKDDDEKYVTLPKKKGTYYIKVSKLTDKTTGVYELETYKE